MDVNNEIILDKSFVDNPKLKCVYDMLSEINGFRDIVNNVFENSDNYILNFRVAQDLKNPKGTKVSGLTKKESLSKYTIKLDKFEMENNSLLFIAKLLIHEGIHANLYAKIANYSSANLQNIFLNNNEFDYEEAFLQYYYASFVVNDSNWQHNFMANEFLPELSELLSTFHSMYPDEQFRDSYENNFDWQTFYKDLSISGSLTETNYFKQTYTNDLNPTIIQRINLNFQDATDLSQSNNICD